MQPYAPVYEIIECGNDCQREKLMKMKMTRAILMVSATAAMALGLAACGDDQADQLAEQLAGKPVVEAVAAAGGHCGPEQAGGQRTCSLEGASFALSPGAWRSQAGQRERECNAKAVGADTVLLTNGSWVIAGDDKASLETLQRAIGEHGAPARVEDYCANPEG